MVGGSLIAPEFDLDGYLECVERCRAAYPELVILSGVEMGQPHRHAAELADLLSRASLDRVLGSLHCLLDRRRARDEWREVVDEVAADQGGWVSGSDGGGGPQAFPAVLLLGPDERIEPREVVPVGHVERVEVQAGPQDNPWEPVGWSGSLSAQSRTGAPAPIQWSP